MNLELIKKYEKEFLHMLHGGKVLMGKKDPVTNTIKWYPSVLNPFVETSNTIVVVIDDIYCTYRKALAEGKIVEANYNKWVFPKIPTKRWDIMAGEDFDRYGIDDLRIKPEEPEFKVGDFVRYIHTNSPKPLRIININCERYYFENAEFILRVDEIEKWEPKEGDLCVVWDNDDIDCAVIIKFDYIDASGKYSWSHTWWDNCMPFTGVLPPHMKDNK